MAAPAAPIVVAIDGPSGVGKSTVARRLARRLGVPFLDTGAMYRAVALRVLASGADPADHDAVAAIAAKTDVALRARPDGSFEVLLDGAPVEPSIRTPEVGEATSTIAAYPEVRRRLERVLTSDPGLGVIRHADAGYEEAIRFAAEQNITKDKFEFQMLYGIRTDLQSRLVRQGYRVRVYIPFGRDWFPYFMRRLAERPANLLFFAKNFFRSATPTS